MDLRIRRMTWKDQVPPLETKMIKSRELMKMMNQMRIKVQNPAARWLSGCGGISAGVIPPDSCYTGLCGGQWPHVDITRRSTMYRSVSD